MPFILIPGSIAKFETLRKNYEDQKHVDLSEEPSIIGVPTFFGGANVIRRNKQITFLEKVHTLMKLHLINEEQINTPQQWEANLIASKFMIAACLHLLSEMSSSKRRSVLYKIIEDNLGITPSNFLDEEDKEECYLTANRLINTPNAFEQANTLLKRTGHKPFTEKEWSKFTKFLHERCHKNETKGKPNYFPFVSLTQPFFGTAFSYVGATVGIVAAEAVSNSTTAIAPRVHLTALVGSTLLVINPAGSTGVVLLAPVIAARLLTSFCTISLSNIMGSAMRIIGQGVGIGVGIPFDIAYNLLWSICSLIGRTYNKKLEMTLINGIRIADGIPIIAGIPVQVLSTQELPEGYTTKTLEITENGALRIEGEEIQDADQSIHLPQEVLDELEKQLLAYTKDKETKRVANEEAKEADEHSALSIL